MSEELELLKEYFFSLGLDQRDKLTEQDLRDLKSELKEAGEFGLVNFLNSLSRPEELMDYIGSED